LASDLEAFGQSVASSSWWNNERIGYCVAAGGPCVGDGPQGMSVELSTTPDTQYTDSDLGGSSSLRDWLTTAVANGQLPPPSTNTIYVLYFPATTTVTLDGVASCSEEGFNGYHDWLVIQSTRVSYVVAVECTPLPPPFPSVAPITLLQSTTLTASHEIVEASTDPVPPGTSTTTSGGFALGMDVNNWGWIDVTGGGEVADMCVDLFGLNQDQTSDGPFTVQRIWSLGQAASDVDPCNPIPSGDVYFNAAPEQTAFFAMGVGDSATFTVDAFSDGLMGAWTLTAQDWSESETSYLGFNIGGAASSTNPQVSVQNGSKVQITVTLLRDPSSLPTQEADGSIISFAGDPSRPSAAHFWPIAVMSTAGAAAAGLGPTPSGARVAIPRRSVRHPGIHRPGPGITRARY
jgi:hypothetical protein